LSTPLAERQKIGSQGDISGRPSPGHQGERGGEGENAASRIFFWRKRKKKKKERKRRGTFGSAGTSREESILRNLPNAKKRGGKKGEEHESTQP